MRITVFTPTFNRAYIIEKLYQSLKKQTFTDFEWVVINDGSTDDTDKLFKKIISDSHDFPIRYLSVPNGGKHRAINHGVKLAQGELFFIVDSDDYLTNDALEIIDNVENSIPKSQKSEFAGICGLRGYDENIAIGTTFKEEKQKILDITVLERNRYNIFGDKSEVFYTEILKKYPFPEFKNEKFVTECVVWDKIAYDNYKLRFFNEIVYICNYLPDGLTASYQQSLIKSPQGYGLYIYQSDMFKKINGLEKWKTYYQYYNEERDTLNYFQMSKYLHMGFLRFYFRILGMKIFYKLYDKYD